MPFHLDIVIPSLNRISKLDRCLNSLFLADGLDYCKVYIYLSDPVEYQHYWSYFQFAEGKVFVMLEPNYKVPEFWNTHLKGMTADAMMCCNDDCEFHKDTITNILQEFNKMYPDYDGVMGCMQSNAIDDQGFRGAFPVIGRKFADRFPDRKVWCPDYFRLHADEELMLYAKSLGRFQFSEKCRIVHWHPAFGGVIDTTHLKVREYREQDAKTFKIRRAKGFLWGKDYYKVGDVAIKMPTLSLKGVQ